jgi:hypothetical protein
MSRAVELTEKERAKLRAAGKVTYRALEEWREAHPRKWKQIAKENGMLGGRPPAYDQPCKKGGRKVARHRFDKNGKCKFCGQERKSYP